MGEKAAVYRVKTIIQERFSDPITLPELASEARLSLFHLLRVLARDVGMPPHAFQTQVRLAHSLILVKRGAPLAHVALEVGFADQSHFNRHFKRFLGITPGRYQSQLKNRGFG